MPTSARSPRTDRRDHGSSTVEFVIGAALMVLLLLVIVQFAVYFHVRSVAHTAARHGLDQVRVVNGSTEAGVAVTNEFLVQSGGGLTGHTVGATRTAERSSVTVRGNVVSVVPGVSLGVDVSVAGPTERIEP